MCHGEARENEEENGVYTKEIQGERIHQSDVYTPHVKVNFTKCASSAALFVRSSSVCSDCATEIKSIREPVDDSLNLLVPRSKTKQET